MCDLDARYQEELRIKDYEFSGDAYDDERYKELRQKWSVKPKPEGDQYLRLVRTASEAHWAHLRLLADFMEIGRIPRSWEKDLLPKDQQQRWGRTNIRIIDYSGEGVVRNEVVHDDTGLDAGKLKSKLLEKGQGDTEFRLYVVEDLSRNVIEVLGTEFQIDPEFFRAHIVDYSWYNVRDRWREPRPLEVFRKRRNWFQIRWMTARYCETEKDFEHAAEEAKGFNILRRPDHDGSKGWWDSEKAVVAQTRSKASYWLKPEKTSKPRLGVLLLDPTISTGLPLWGGLGRYNFHPIPTTLTELESLTKKGGSETINQSTDENHHKHRLFEDFAYWMGRSDLFAPGQSEHLELVPVLVLLHLVGSEWHAVCDYTKTRLNQIDLEIKSPNVYSPGETMDAAMKKLHICRKFLTVYREMVSKTLQTVFQPFSKPVKQLIDEPLHGTRNTEMGPGDHPVGGWWNTADHIMSRLRINQATAFMPDTNTTAALKNSLAAITACRDDFDNIMRTLDEHQSRVDRLTSVATAVMALEDTRRANGDARKLSLLTWLATFFLPFGIVSSVLGLQKRSEISLDTIQLYFEITLPLAVFTLALGGVLHPGVVREAAKTQWNILSMVWKKNDVKKSPDPPGPGRTQNRPAARRGNADIEKGMTTSTSVGAQDQSTTSRGNGMNGRA